MTEIERRVRDRAPGAHCEKTGNADPDSRFTIRVPSGYALGWGANRLKAWEDAARLVLRP